MQFSFGYREVHSRIRTVDFSWSTGATTVAEEGIIIIAGVKKGFVCWISCRSDGCRDECL